MVGLPVKNDVLPQPAPAVRHQPLLIDPQPLFLAALSGLLAGPPLNALVEAAGSSAVLDGSARMPDVDLVLCDLRVEPVPASEIAERLSRMPRPVPMILLGDTDEVAALLGTLSWPVSGFFTKDATIEELLAGVDAVLAGHRVIGERALEGLLDR